MSNNYECVTALTVLPSEHVKEWHRLALDAAGFSFEDNVDGVYMFAPAVPGVCSIEIEDVADWLDDTGLIAHQNEPRTCWRLSTTTIVSTGRTPCS